MEADMSSSIIIHQTLLNEFFSLNYKLHVYILFCKKGKILRKETFYQVQWRTKCTLIFYIKKTKYLDSLNLKLLFANFGNNI